MTTTTRSVPSVTRSRALECTFLLGLGGVFLVNACAAVIAPGDFQHLVERSEVGRLLGTPSWLVAAIGINDLALGVALMAVAWWRAARPYVLAWAGLWLLAVSAVKLSAL